MDKLYRRVECYKNTRVISQSKYPITQPSIKYRYTDLQKEINLATVSRPYKTNILVFNEDAIDCAIKYQAIDCNPLILNLASDVYAGGGVESGCGAQEESLFRRSNYFLSLTNTPDFYPIKADEAIYSPHITVFKDSERVGWSQYQTPYKMDFIACPGTKYPDTFITTNQKGEILKRMNSITTNVLKNKIRLIFNIAIKYNHDTVILGAMGCGMWQSPPAHVAEIFNEVCSEYYGVFKNIIFAVLRGKEYLSSYDQNDNYDVFMKEIKQTF